MKNFILIIVSLSFISSCSNDKDFFLTEENALLSCGGKSRIIENDKEEIINTEVKDLKDEQYYVHNHQKSQIKSKLIIFK